MSKKSRLKHKQRKQGLPPESLVYTGGRDKRPAQLTAVCYDETNYHETSDFTAKNNGRVLWLDIRNLSDTALIEKIGNEFHIHPLALEDVLNTQQRAKLEEYDNGIFFVIPSLRLLPGSLEFESEQISFFAGNNFIISFQEDPDDTFISVRKRAHEGLGKLRKKGADYLLYAMIDTVVDGYYSILDALEGSVLELEETLHMGGINERTKAKLFQVKRASTEFKHRVLPLREAATRFYRTESDIIDESNRLYFRDLMDHVAQILDAIDSQRDMLANMEAFYQSEAANRLNHVMRLLTVISTIFIPLSFIAGVYGMNFDNMPELHTRNGYFVLLGVMVFVMVGMLGYFKAKKWL